MGKDAQGPGTARTSQQGSTLIESLLSVTLLGLAALTALQAGTQASQRSRSALQRTVAVHWSTELAERLHADANTDLQAWQVQAAAALGAVDDRASDVAQVTVLAGTPTTPSQFQLQLRWTDAADRRLAVHRAVVERAGRLP